MITRFVAGWKTPEDTHEEIFSSDEEAKRFLQDSLRWQQEDVAVTDVALADRMLETAGQVLGLSVANDREWKFGDTTYFFKRVMK